MAAASMRYEFRPVDRCNMCGSPDSRMLGMRLSASQGLRPRAAEGVAVPVKQCRACGLVFADPQPVPDSLADHYDRPPESYWRAEAQSWHPDYFARQIAAAKRLLPFSQGMTALDIGSGLGKAMKSLALAGFDAWGIEPSPPFRDKSIELMGLDPERIQLAAMEDADFPLAQFDFITFGAVLEHLYDPHAALVRAMGWLKPGGVVQLEVPSADHLVARLINLYFTLRGTNYVTNISPMHPPFHLYEFTHKSFRDFEVAEHWYDVCTIFHLPRPLHGPLRWWMERTDTGMQLTVFLRRGER